MKGPFHQCYTARPCTVLNPFDAQYSAALVLDRIRNLTNSRGGRCYLFVDPWEWVYVIGEDRAAARTWLEGRKDWWRGTFTSRATLDDVMAELA